MRILVLALTGNCIAGALVDMRARITRSGFPHLDDAPMHGTTRTPCL